VIVNGRALPVCGFEFSVFGTSFGDLDFAVGFSQLGVYLLLAFGTDAFGFAHISHPPSTASTIKAKGSRIMDIVTMRSYFRTFCVVEAEVTSRIEA
jgi:hypothetical protein